MEIRVAAAAAAEQNRRNNSKMSWEWRLVTAAVVAVGVWLCLAHQLEKTIDPLRDEKRGERLYKAMRRDNLKPHDCFYLGRERLAHVDLRERGEYLCPLRVAEAFLHRERGGRPEHRVVCAFAVRQRCRMCPNPYDAHRAANLVAAASESFRAAGGEVGPAVRHLTHVWITNLQFRNATYWNS